MGESQDRVRSRVWKIQHNSILLLEHCHQPDGEVVMQHPQGLPLIHTLHDPASKWGCKTTNDNPRGSFHLARQTKALAAGLDHATASECAAYRAQPRRSTLSVRSLITSVCGGHACKCTMSSLQQLAHARRRQPTALTSIYTRISRHQNQLPCLPQGQMYQRQHKNVCLFVMI